jgi:glyoxylase-like metal-dependent hydrolase (beta-lactamase superfamily II)
MKVIRETDRLFRLTRFGMVNCFLVTEETGLTLIDTGLSGSAKEILAAAKQLASPINRIVLTHAHIDHVGSLDALCVTLPQAEVFIGARESRLLAGDLSLLPGESGKPLFGFIHVNSRPTRLLSDGDSIGSLQTISTPGHTPGHFSLLDTRDGSLIAGDAFTTQMGIVAAGAFKPLFPFPAIFSWNRTIGAESARKLCNLNPARLASGHGPTIENPRAAMDQAVELVFRQCGKVLH